MKDKDVLIWEERGANMKKPIKNLINKNDLIKRIVKSENIINSKSKFKNWNYSL